jgi:hypothetical protein
LVALKWKYLGGGILLRALRSSNPSIFTPFLHTRSLIPSNSLLGPFTKPVDWQSLGLWDYPKVITNFMDLGTVRSNLSQNNYDTLEAAANDVRQVFKNCCKVRGSGLWGRGGMERGERREERRKKTESN